MRLTEAFAPLLDLVYPPRCPLCGEGIGAPRVLDEALADSKTPGGSSPRAFA
jgi:hypothetical protein